MLRRVVNSSMVLVSLCIVYCILSETSPITFEDLRLIMNIEIKTTISSNQSSHTYQMHHIS